MSRISQSQTISAFGMPSDVVSMSVCSDSHMAAAPGCPNPYTEYFAKGTEPKNYCNVHGDGSLVDQTQQTDGISPDAITIYQSNQATVHTQTPDASGGASEGSAGGYAAAAGSGVTQGAVGSSDGASGGSAGGSAAAAGSGGTQGTAGNTSGGSGNPAAGAGSGTAGGGTGSTAGGTPSGTGNPTGSAQQGSQSTAGGSSASAAGNAWGGSSQNGVIQIGGSQAGSGSQQGGSDKDVIEILNNIPPAQ